jgi:hypothetical protein
VTQSDFSDWKRHPVTQQVFSQLSQRVADLIDEIVEQTATATTGEMAEKAGAIKAHRDFLNIEFDEETHGS